MIVVVTTSSVGAEGSLLEWYDAGWPSDGVKDKTGRMSVDLFLFLTPPTDHALRRFEVRLLSIIEILIHQQYFSFCNCYRGSVLFVACLLVSTLAYRMVRGCLKSGSSALNLS